MCFGLMSYGPFNKKQNMSNLCEQSGGHIHSAEDRNEPWTPQKIDFCFFLFLQRNFMISMKL